MSELQWKFHQNTCSVMRACTIIRDSRVSALAVLSHTAQRPTLERPRPASDDSQQQKIRYLCCNASLFQHIEAPSTGKIEYNYTKESKRFTELRDTLVHHVFHRHLLFSKTHAAFGKRKVDVANLELPHFFVCIKLKNCFVEKSVITEKLWGIPMLK